MQLRASRWKGDNLAAGAAEFFGLAAKILEDSIDSRPDDHQL
jgi:hypothetical protein